MRDLGRIYLDTNIFVMAFETHGDLASQVTQLLSAAPIDAPPSFVTSELTISELLVMPYRNGDTVLVETYEKLLFMSPWLKIVPVDRDALLLAANLRAARPSRKMPDALHLSTASLTGCTHFLSRDKGISDDEALMLTILRPDEPTLTSLTESLCA